MWARLSFWLATCISTLEQLRSQDTSDAQLVALAQRGGEEGKEAFQVLVERHQRWLAGLLRHLVSSPQDAEDLAQNVMVRAFFGLKNFRQDASFRTWLRVIASREAFGLYRKRGDVVAADPDALLAILSQEPDQHRRDEREALVLALSRVPYPYREILVLRYLEELSLDEIAQALDIGLSAAKMRLSRARDFFKEAYDGATTR